MEERLFEGEDPTSSFPDDARHWIAVYREMVLFQDQLLERLHNDLRRLPPGARTEAIDGDIGLIEAQLGRYQRRLEYWYARQWELEGLQVDAETRVVTYHDRAIHLTRREYQLLLILVERSPEFVTARQLLVRAWHDARLPEETLRTYIVRLRSKIAQLEVKAEIVNRPRRGYAILFEENRLRARVIPALPPSA
jgi:DNA-binding response OmpR family regulator